MTIESCNLCPADARPETRRSLRRLAISRDDLMQVECSGSSSTELAPSVRSSLRGDAEIGGVNEPPTID
jgi:hypothetical protein